MGIGDVVGNIADGVKGAVTDPVKAVAGAFGVGDPSGNDHGSSNWAAWGHPEIRSMLDQTVNPGNIDEVARLWGTQGPALQHIITSCTTDLQRIVSNGWRGQSAGAATASLAPINDWAGSVHGAAGDTTQLMSASGSAAGQAKATVPAAPSHNWAESLGTTMLLGPAGGMIDAVGQHHAQEQSRAEAVRIMTNVYSAPINESRAAVPTYPQLADPTVQRPDPAPIGGPSPGPSRSGPGLPVGGDPVPGGYPASRQLPPSSAGLQGISSPGGARYPNTVGPPSVSSQGAGPQFPGAGPGAGAAAAAADVPIMAPMAGGGAIDDFERAPRAGRGAVPGRAGLPGGLGGRANLSERAGGGAGFGPRGSSAAAAQAAEARPGAGLGGGAAAGRGGAGDMPMGGMGAGRGRDEDAEHRRPSYLIEMDDVFNDGRKVAPPVIGEAPPEYYR
ncbi:MAG: hypothetical protein ACRDSP_11185 [Pseudonocardiaceae bacterium]